MSAISDVASPTAGIVELPLSTLRLWPPCMHCASRADAVLPVPGSAEIDQWLGMPLPEPTSPFHHSLAYRAITACASPTRRPARSHSHNWLLMGRLCLYNDFLW